LLVVKGSPLPPSKIHELRSNEPEKMALMDPFVLLAWRLLL